jgi:hypothetical protein
MESLLGVVFIRQGVLNDTGVSDVIGVTSKKLLP